MATKDSGILDALVEGLTAPVTEAERETASRPPYPLPAAHRGPRDRLLAELVAKMPAVGDGPSVVARVQAHPQPYRSEVHVLGLPGGFEFGDAACALLAIGALDDEDLGRLSGHLPEYCGAPRQQVLNCLARDDVHAAHAAAYRIADGLSWVGHRDIGAVHADRGNAAGFFADWRRYAAGHDRDGMVDLKTRLVIGVARQDGWRAALGVAEDKRIGPKFARYAFDTFLDGDVDGLLRLYAGDAAGILSEQDQLTTLAQAVRAASGHNPERDHPRLAAIVDRIIAVDPTTDKAAMRWRDSELYSLWPAFGDRATLDRVRAAIRTPNYRRELTKLPRDFSRPPQS